MVIERLFPHQDQMSRFLISFFSLIYFTLPLAKDSRSFSDIVDSMKTVQGNFQQTVVDNQGEIIQEVEGSFYFKKPNMFKWNYQAPFTNQIISDGELLYLFDPELKQVIMSSLSKLGGVSPAMLLVSEKARKFFVIEKLDKNKNTWFRAIPKNTELTSFKSIEILFTVDTLSEMLVLDNFENTTRIKFNKIQNNAPINDAFFLFNTPDDVDVISN